MGLPKNWQLPNVSLYPDDKPWEIKQTSLPSNLDVEYNEPELNIPATDNNLIEAQNNAYNKENYANNLLLTDYMNKYKQAQEIEKPDLEPYKQRQLFRDIVSGIGEGANIISGRKDLVPSELIARQEKRDLAEQQQAQQQYKQAQEFTQKAPRDIALLQAQLLKTSTDYQVIQDERNPNSQRSQLARAIAKQAGLRVPDNASAADLKPYLEQASKLYQSQETNKLRQEMQMNQIANQQELLRLKSELTPTKSTDKLEKAEVVDPVTGQTQVGVLNLNTGQFKPVGQASTKGKDQLGAKQQEQLISNEEAYIRAENIKNKLSQLYGDAKYTGPLWGRAADLAQSWGVSTEKATNRLNTELLDMLNKYVKEYAGTAVSESEKERLLKTMPKISDDRELFNINLNRYFETAKEIREDHLKALGNVTGREQVQQTSTQQQDQAAKPIIIQSDNDANKWALQNINNPDPKVREKAIMILNINKDQISPNKQQPTSNRLR